MTATKSSSVRWRKRLRTLLCSYATSRKTSWSLSYKVDISSIASLNTLQLITEDGAIGKGLKGNFAQNTWPGLLAYLNTGKSFLSLSSMTGDGGGRGDSLPSNHPSKVAQLTPYRSETNKDALTMDIWG